MSHSGQLIHGVTNRFVQSIFVSLTRFKCTALLTLGLAGLDMRCLVSEVFNRPPAHLDRIQTPRHFNHRRRLAINGKVIGKAFGINRR